VLGTGAGEYRHLVGGTAEGLVVQTFQRLTSDDSLVLLQTKLACDGACGDGVVARDHLHPDGGRLAFGNSHNRFLPRRIDQTDHPEKDQVLFDILKGEIVGAVRHLLHGERQDALTFGAELLDHADPLSGVDRLGT
jgi:hypothetical protein